MTVGDLIAELQKFPSHYTAVIEVEDSAEASECTGLEVDCRFIGSVSLETNVGSIGPWVKITEEFL
jgi:hypothetical protein